MKKTKIGISILCVAFILTIGTCTLLVTNISSNANYPVFAKELEQSYAEQIDNANYPVFTKELEQSYVERIDFESKRTKIHNDIELINTSYEQKTSSYAISDDVIEPIPGHFIGGEGLLKALETDGMVRVVGVNDIVGWAYAKEIYGEVARTPEEAIEMERLKKEYIRENNTNFIYVDVYDDEMTVIDKYGIYICDNILTK